MSNTEWSPSGPKLKTLREELMELPPIVREDKLYSRKLRLRDTGWGYAIGYGTWGIVIPWHQFTRKTLTPFFTSGVAYFFVFLTLSNAWECSKDKDTDACQGVASFASLLASIPGAKAGIEWDRRRAVKFFRELEQ